MKLMIIESPGKIKKLSAILGNEWRIVASVGHVRDLPQKEMGVQAPDFKPDYELTERGSETVSKIKALVKQADTVYLATDPDREGESISWHLQQCLKLTNPLRITFNEITENAVRGALAAPRTIDVRRVAAQEARRVLDRLVGYMVSPVLSANTGERLSAGRVQSVAVRIVVDRERQILAFRVTAHFGVTLSFACETGGEWSAQWLVSPDFVTDEAPYFTDRPFAAAVADVQAVAVTSYIESETRRSPPPPFTTSSMQQAASVALDLDPKAAMDAAQALYEQGHISYHRTDNPNVSPDAMPDIKRVAGSLKLPVVERQRLFKAPEGAQAGHPAITPTHWDLDAAGETSLQRDLYALIRLRAIASQLADARYAVRTVRLEAVERVLGKRIEFEGKGRTLIFSGWLALVAGDQTEADTGETEPTNEIPACQSGQRLDVARGVLVDRKTKPPGRYTQATLVGKLESEGIGRPATYAAIMDNITARGYVQKDGKKLIPTRTGALIVDSLSGKFEFVDLSFTRDIEKDLDQIAEGQAAYKAVIANVHTRLLNEIAALNASNKPKFPCSACGKAMRRIAMKDGAFWGCSGHPVCSATRPDENGSPGERKEPVVSAFKCHKCGAGLIRRTKAGKGGYDFFGCTAGKEVCKSTYNVKNNEPIFPAK